MKVVFTTLFVGILRHLLKKCAFFATILTIKVSLECTATLLNNEGITVTQLQIVKLLVLFFLSHHKTQQVELKLPFHSYYLVS